MTRHLDRAPGRVLPLFALLALLVGAGAMFPGEGWAADASGREPLSSEGNIPSEGNIGKVQKRIEALRAWRIAEELGFDEKTNARLFTILREGDARRIRIEADNREVLRSLRNLVKEPSPDPKRIAAALDRLAENQRQQRVLEEEHLRRLREVLDPAQAANYLFFELRFQRELRERVVLTIRERGGMMQGGKGPGVPASPGAAEGQGDRGKK